MDTASMATEAMVAVAAEPVGPESEGNLAIGLLWFVLIALMFFAQHHVCDHYFVPAINCFVNTMRSSKLKCARRWGDDAVAGATICALGCNGPELFTNLISLYTGNDAGIGVVVGSEIFNLLIICGCAVLAAPVVPLMLETGPFVRDTISYFISIVLLYWTLLDKKVELVEAVVLLCAAVCYVTVVYFTEDIVNCISKDKNGVGSAEPLNPGQVVRADNDAQTGRMHGVTVEIKEILHSRMADTRTRQSITGNVDLGMAVTVGDAPRPDTYERGSIGVQLDQNNEHLTKIVQYKFLTEVAILGEGVIQLKFEPSSFYSVSLHVTTRNPQCREELVEKIKAKSYRKPIIYTYDPTAWGAIKHFRDELIHKPLLGKILAIPEFIVDFLLKATLFAVDVKDSKKEGRWPLCFLGAMAWLAIFSYVMLEVAVQINKNIPVLPLSFLGITICAIGTSFPNAVASVILASQNKPAAAIANALGSNVQNVFLAMAVPWMIYLTQTNFEPIEQNVKGINEGVMWMVVTLLLLVFFVVIPPVMTLTKSVGMLFIVLYVSYLVLTSGETFGWWPAIMN